MSKSPQFDRQNESKGRIRYRKLLGSVLKWAIVLATFSFLAKAVYDNWHEVSTLHINLRQGWPKALAALVIALCSNGWLGILWGWTLGNLGYPVSWVWAMRIFLTIEIAKFLPGNVWHMYGRVRAAQRIGIPIPVGTASVLLEPILITAAAMIFALLNGSHPALRGLGGISAFCILLGVHPRIFGQVSKWLTQLQYQLRKRFGRRSKSQPNNSPKRVYFQHYPLKILLGELIFVGLRCYSFLLIVSLFGPLPAESIAPLVGGFSFAWIVGLVMPGAPDGIGIFETLAILLLRGILPSGQLVAVVLIYRMVGVIAIALGALLGWLMGLKAR